MDKKKTKEEAQEAAKKLMRTLSCNAETYDTSALIEVTVDFPGGHMVLQTFPYAEPVPVPAIDVPVINSKGQVGYSLDKLHKSGDLMAMPFPGSCGPLKLMNNWEPVEIVRNNEHAKALELLDKGTNDMTTCESAVWNHDAKRFLADSEKAGEV